MDEAGVDSFDELTEFVIRLVVELIYVCLAAAVVELVEAHHFDVGVFLHQQQHHMRATAQEDGTKQRVDHESGVARCRERVKICGKRQKVQPCCN